MGGVDFARGLLERALGPEKAAAMLGRATGGAITGFKMLRNADPAQVAPFIAQEHPQTIALILSQAEPPQAAAILEQLSASMQAEVVHRIATLGHIAPEVLDEVEQTLEVILKNVMEGKREVGGSQVVANILNVAGGRLEKASTMPIRKWPRRFASKCSSLMIWLVWGMPICRWSCAISRSRICRLRLRPLARRCGTVFSPPCPNVRAYVYLRIWMPCHRCG